MNKTFTKSLTAVLVSTALVTTPVMAKGIDKKEQIKNENIGFGTGLVIGAIVAGPFGAFFSGVAGSLIAKHVNKVEENEVLTAELDKVTQERELQLASFQQRLQQSEQEYQQELITLQQSYLTKTQMQADNLLMSLQFSTGSSEIKHHYNEQISALASMLKQSPEVSVDLSGYTDLQGSEQRNQSLSLARVKAVKEALVNNGVEENKVNIFAFGENAPVVANAQQEASFYDRRVVIKLQNTNTEVANNLNPF